jgi:hypothetical protein
LYLALVPWKRKNGTFIMAWLEFWIGQDGKWVDLVKIPEFHGGSEASWSLTYREKRFPAVNCSRYAWCSCDLKGDPTYRESDNFPCSINALHGCNTFYLSWPSHTMWDYLL